MENNLCGLNPKDFQAVIDGKETDLYILRNANGYEVAICNYGGAIVSCMVPDKDGKIANVIEGHKDIKSLASGNECFLSTLIGRWGNRIKEGKFTLGGKQYQVALNDGPNHLHGGPTGYHARVWDAQQMGSNTLALKYVSAYGEEGFTGEVKIFVEYTWTDDNELVIDYLATSNKKTIINLTHHAFFALAGTANPTPSVCDNVLEVNGDFYLPTDDVAIPTGEILKVEGTPFDFRAPKTIGDVIDADDEQIKFGHGIDHNFVLNKPEVGALTFAARVTDPKSGRTLETYTTEPGLQVYTGNFLNGYEIQNGATAPRRSAICLEAQHFPDSPNRPYFPPVVLCPGERYTQKTVYKFGTV